MKNDRVKDWMTPHPITINPKTTVPQAHKLMRECSVRRLPVVERGRLVGIVTLGDLRQAEPSESNLLSQYELRDLIQKECVEKIMTWEPITAAPEMTVHEAARLMLAHKIAGLPVVQNDQLIGMITESDIFRALVEQLPSDEVCEKEFASARG